MPPLDQLSTQVRQYLLVTFNYWAFTLTDGALRMLVLLYFHELGYAPLQLALLFVFYEVFGVVTNLFGGWLGAKLGLNRTMNLGLLLQVIALGMLLVPANLLSIAWVMSAQAISGIAKDLNKMSAKSAIKLLVPGNAQDKLYKWIALLTGSKNALKGLGFFMGAALLAWLGFHLAILVMCTALAVIWLMSVIYLAKDLGKAKNKPKFSELLSKSRAINLLSAARFFLFGSRDVWFVVALPVFLSESLGWSHEWVGAFLAIWIIGYGAVQSIAPLITGNEPAGNITGSDLAKSIKTLQYWSVLLTLIPATIALALTLDIQPQWSLLTGLGLYAVVFAINSALHSFLIVSYASEDKVSLDVGFYYMANALGRLVGTVLSGWIYQSAGLYACLWVSTIFLLMASIISLYLPRQHSGHNRLLT
jgi:predicted MFS family arabinose efflux permease